MKVIEVIFDVDYSGDTIKQHFQVEDSFSTFGNFIPNHNYHQSSKRDKIGKRPISDLTSDEYGNRLYEELNYNNMLLDDTISISEVLIKFLPKIQKMKLHSDLILFAIKLQRWSDRSDAKKREVINNFCCVNEKYHCRNHEVEEFLRKWNWF